ncbi:hypothetical protein ACI2KR_08395 [Pseudomonas luteola]
MKFQILRFLLSSAWPNVGQHLGPKRLMAYAILVGAASSYMLYLSSTIFMAHAEVQMERQSLLLRSLSDPQIEKCITEQKINDETVCLVFDKSLPITADDPRLEKTLKDFATDRLSSYTWEQSVSTPNGRLFDVSVGSNDYERLILSVTSKGQMVYVLASKLFSTEMIISVYLKFFSFALLYFVLVLGFVRSGIFSKTTNN